MASEEPPSLRDNPQATDTRPGSAPALTSVTATSGVPTVNMNSTNDGTTAAQGSAAPADLAHPASGQQVNVSTEAKARLTDVIGQSGEHTPDMAGGSTQVDVKTDSEAEAFPPPTISDVSSDMIDQQHEGSPVKKENEADGFLLSNPQQQTKEITLDNVRKAADITDLAKLEAGTEEAREVLDSLRQPMADSEQREQLDWLNRIEKLKSQSNRTRTLVGVAGSTGAGKSSLINALLDEEKLLPTSGFRACTAVITEISYNESEDPWKAYRCVVEFLSRDDWISEVELLFGDLVEDKQLSPGYLDNNTVAGIAYAKIKAVRPDLTQDMIVKSTVEQLANSDAVAKVLGTTIHFACSNPRDLCKMLQKYLDSKDKDTKGGPRKEQDMAFWPLIKRVKVFTRASVLKTGVCIVDLPGIHDSNTARSAVARKYMAECSDVWVTAPIKRAVDDEAARKLLGDFSRVQMKLDGMYSHVTFICTMTDSLQLSESVEAFDDDGKIHAAFAREGEVEEMIRAKKESIQQLKDQLDNGDTEFKGLKRELSTWKALQKKQRKGQAVCAPRIPAKRKRTTVIVTRRRRREVVDDDSDEDDTAGGNPLTAGEISSKLIELDERLKNKDDECTDMEKRLETMKGDLSALENEIEETVVRGKALCVQRRNEHVKSVLKVDFANGLREIDEVDAEADDENFDPSVKHRDYEEVGHSFPVFCISSKAYQQLRLPTKRETRVEGFRNLTDTEIPLLQQHAMKLPEQGRVRAYKTFLNDFCGLLGSLTIWANSSILEHDGQVMSKAEQTYEVKHLQAAAEDLEKKLDELIWTNKMELDNIIQNRFLSRAHSAINNAGRDLAKIVSAWPAKKEDGGWGILFSTYKATCRRHGSKTKSEKSRDFNEDILEPYLKKIATDWDQAFGHLIPTALDRLVAAFGQGLREFHSTMSSRAELEKSKMASLRILGQQITNYEASMQEKVVSMKATLQEEQRQASRTFLPEIKKQMEKTYEQVASEKGKGCYLRMRNHMNKQVGKNKYAIYRKATQRVMTEIKKAFENNRKELKETSHEIVSLLTADFQIVISSSEMLEASEVAREHIRGVLHKVDARFEALLCTEPMDLDSIQPADAVPQQSSIAGNADVGDTTGELVETDSTAELGAKDTGL